MHEDNPKDKSFSSPPVPSPKAQNLMGLLFLVPCPKHYHGSAGAVISVMLGTATRDLLLQFNVIKVGRRGRRGRGSYGRAEEGEGR